MILGEDFTIKRAGKVAGDCVEERLHALVAIGRSHEHRTKLLRDRALPDRLVNQIDRYVAFFEEERHDLIREHRQRLEHPLTGSLGSLDHVGRDGRDAHRLALLSLEIERLAIDEIDHAFEARLDSDRNLKRYGRQAQLGLELADHIGRIGASPVHLVDERDARHGVALHLAIDGDRLRLHSGDGA